MIYKVEYSVPLLEARTIKISKIVPSFLDNRTKGGEAQDMRDSFAHLATVEYHTFRSSRIRMGSLDVATNDYFRREGWSLKTLGRLVIFHFLEPQYFLAMTFRDRVFTGPDGKEYLWSLDQMNCKARTSIACECKQTELTWTIVALRE